MAEEQEQVNTEQLKTEVSAAITKQEQITPEYTESEQKAMEAGWNPDEASLEGSDKEWIPADEFLRNKSFFTEIKKLKREVRKQQKVTEAFKQQNTIVAEKAYDQAVKDLKAQKRQAAEESDVVQMLEIDEQIDTLQEQRAQQAPVTEPQYSPEDWQESFETFIDANSWYNTDDVKTAYADSMGTKYAAAHPDASPEDVYAHVTSKVTEQFTEAPRTRPQAVATQARRTSSKSKGSTHAVSDIPDEHRGIAMTLIKTGQVSEEEYLKQYFPEDYS